MKKLLLTSLLALLAFAAVVQCMDGDSSYDSDNEYFDGSWSDDEPEENADPMAKYKWYCSQCTCTSIETKKGDRIRKLNCDHSGQFKAFDHEKHDPSMYCYCEDVEDGETARFSPSGLRTEAFRSMQKDSWAAINSEVNTFLESKKRGAQKLFALLSGWARSYRAFLRKNGYDDNTNDSNVTNNYSDVLAYSFNRPNLNAGAKVMRTSSAFTDTSDYVNADYILQTPKMFLTEDVPKEEEESSFEFVLKNILASMKEVSASDKQLIATQGPKKDEAVNPFLRLLLSFKADLVVAVGPEKERGGSKFQKYFGTPGFVFRDPYNRDFTVTTLAVQRGSVDLRTQKNYHGATPPVGIDMYSVLVTGRDEDGVNSKTVTVAHFVDWQDMMATDVHLTLWASQLMNQYHRVVVHCSAGVGRTGTLIASNTMLKNAALIVAQANGERSAHETITRLRRALDPKQVTMMLKGQREFAVFRPPQFVMLYDTAKKILDLIVDVTKTREDGIEAAGLLADAVPRVTFDVDSAIWEDAVQASALSASRDITISRATAQSAEEIPSEVTTPAAVDDIGTDGGEDDYDALLKDAMGHSEPSEPVETEK